MKKTEKIYESDADIDKVETEEPVERKREIEIGSYKAHADTAKRGLYEYQIWGNLTIAVLGMAAQNAYHRIDLRDKEFLKKFEKDMELPIDYECLNGEIVRNPWLIVPNGFKEHREVDKTKDASGKPLTKKAVKVNVKKEKFQIKIDALQKKYDAMKSKKGPRAANLKQKIEDLELKRDRI